MAISFVNKSAFASGTGALTVGAVTGVQANDVIFLFVESANQAITTPTGYSPIGTNFVGTGTAAAAGATRLTWFYQVATGADTTTSVADSGDHTCAIKVAYRGIDSGVGFSLTTGTKTPASTTSTFPAITTTAANSLVLLASGLDLDAASTTTTGTPTNANLTGLVERHDQTVIAGAGGGIVIIEGFKATAGDTGTTTATVTSTIQVYATISARPRVSTGDLNASETGSDTFAATGDVPATGNLAVTETGSDAFAATGTVATAAITGTLAATETGTDTFASTGDVIVKGSLAATEVGSDTFAATAKAIVKGSLAATETGSDVFAATGEVADRIATGNLAATEVGSDTLAATGKAVVKGSLASTETGQDTFSATAKAVVKGALASTETGSDVFAATAKALVQGSLAATETGLDVFAATGTVQDPGIVGTFAATEVGSDTLAAAGQVVVIGELDATEEPDTFASTGSVLVDGSFAAAEVGSDIFVGSGDNVVGGIMSVSEVGSDTLGRYVDDGYVDIGYVGYQIPGRVLVQGAVGATEVGSDVFAANGFSTSITGDLAATEEGSDVFAATGESEITIEGRARAAVFTPASEITVSLRPHKKVVGSTVTPIVVTTSSARILVAPHKPVSLKSRKVRLFKGVAVSAALRGSKVQTRPVSVITGTTFTVPKLSGVSTWSRDVKITTSVPTIVQFKRNKARIGTAPVKVTTVLNPTDQELMAMAMVLRKQHQAKISRFGPEL